MDRDDYSETELRDAGATELRRVLSDWFAESGGQGPNPRYESKPEHILRVRMAIPALSIYERTDVHGNGSGEWIYRTEAIEWNPIRVGPVDDFGIGLARTGALCWYYEIEPRVFDEIDRD